MGISPRVFIISETPLLDGNLSHRLAATPGIAFIGEEMDVKQGIYQVEILKPDMVVWGEHRASSDPLSEIVYLLTKIPGLKILHVDVSSNQIVLYQSRQKVVKDLSDLLQAIEMG